MGMTRCRSCGCELQPWESEFCEGCGPLFLPAMKGELMSDATFVGLVLCVQAGVTAGVWLFVRRAVREMEQ